MSRSDFFRRDALLARAGTDPELLWIALLEVRNHQHVMTFASPTEGDAFLGRIGASLPAVLDGAGLASRVGRSEFAVALTAGDRASALASVSAAVQAVELPVPLTGISVTPRFAWGLSAAPLADFVTVRDCLLSADADLVESGARAAWPPLSDADQLGDPP
jgi:GGDEF domain-containing protein